MVIKEGDKFQYVGKSGELIHVLQTDPSFLARVNGSEFCMSGLVENFRDMVRTGRVKAITDAEYRRGIDRFWAKRNDQHTRRETWV